MTVQLKTKSIMYSRFLCFQTDSFLIASFHLVMSTFLFYSFGSWQNMLFGYIDNTGELVKEMTKGSVKRYGCRTMNYRHCIQDIYVPARISQVVNKQKKSP